MWQCGCWQNADDVVCGGGCWQNADDAVCGGGCWQNADDAVYGGVVVGRMLMMQYMEVWLPRECLC